MISFSALKNNSSDLVSPMSILKSPTNKKLKINYYGGFLKKLFANGFNYTPAKSLKIVK
jgi:hypothetical protein